MRPFTVCGEDAGWQGLVEIGKQYPSGCPNDLVLLRTPGATVCGSNFQSLLLADRLHSCAFLLTLPRPFHPFLRIASSVYHVNNNLPGRLHLEVQQ
jgi:hypothetical protein